MTQNENEGPHKLKQINEVPHGNNELQKRNEEPESKEPENDEVHEINNVDEQRVQRLGFDIPKAIEKIKSQLKSSNCSKDFVEKCKEVIEYLTSQCKDDLKQNKAEETCAEAEAVNQQNKGSDGEHVLIAVVPKQVLKDFHQVIHQSDDEISNSPDDAIFDICVYVPNKLAWYYFGEGRNKYLFRQMGKSDAKSTLNFCMLDNLCCVLKRDSCISMVMYSLKNCDRKTGRWGLKISNDLDTDIHIPDPDLFGFDDNSYDVRLFSRDGNNLYLVFKKTAKESLENKVKFKCFWYLYPNDWDFVFETPYMHESEDSKIKNGNFCVNVSPGNKELFIAAKGDKLHVFVADLQNRGSDLKHHIVGDDETQEDVDVLWKPHSDIHIMLNGQQLSIIEETEDYEDCLHYRNSKIAISDNMTIDHTDYRFVETRFPVDYQDNEETPVKFSRIVSDGTSLWLYLSDGKFETSIAEIRPDEEGVLDFIEHTPPPFSAITMMATGVVRSKHLAELEPMTNFLLEK